MNSNEYCNGLTSGTVTVGATMCLGMTAGPYVTGWLISKFSGGTVTMIGFGNSSMTTIGYIIDDKAVAIGGPASFNLNTPAGATAIVQFVKSLNLPNNSNV